MSHPTPPRVIRYLRDLRWFARHTPGLLTPRNARALWLQSDPAWLSKNRLDLTDEEAEDFIRACKGDA